MKRVDKEISNLITISKWALSCKTKEQLKNVENFMSNHMNNMKPFRRYEMEESHRVMYHAGAVDGIIISLNKSKFANEN